VEEAEGIGDVGQAFEAPPERGGAGMAVAFTTEEAAEVGYQPHRVAQAERKGGVVDRW